MNEYYEKFFIIIIIIISHLFINKLFSNIIFDINFKYHEYQTNIINKKMEKYSKWQLSGYQPYFINGIIRKYKPRRCLEIGVAYGGSSIIILNAIKDIKDSFLISLDLNTKLYCNSKLATGYRVKKYFPELFFNYLKKSLNKFLKIHQKLEIIHRRSIS